MTNIIAMGHGHLTSIHSALNDRDLPHPGAQPENLAAVWLHDASLHQTTYAAPDVTGEIEFNSQVIMKAESQIPDISAAIYCVQFEGGGHVSLGFQRLLPSFDFIHPEAPNLPIEPGSTIVPMDLVSRALEPHMASYLLQLGALRRRVKQRIICLETPPPCEDDAYVSAHLGGYIANPDNIVGAPLRQKLFLLHSLNMRKFCDANDIEYMPAPPQTLTKDGYLVREGYGEDPIRANSWYGEQVLLQIEERISQRIGAFTAFA